MRLLKPRKPLSPKRGKSNKYVLPASIAVILLCCCWNLYILGVYSVGLAFSLKYVLGGYFEIFSFGHAGLPLLLEGLGTDTLAFILGKITLNLVGLFFVLHLRDLEKRKQAVSSR